MTHTTKIEFLNNDSPGFDGMVLIPEGEFQMGNVDPDLNQYESEQTFHTVYVDAFYIDVYEVTNAEYKAFVDANPQWQRDRVYQDDVYEVFAEGYLTHWRDNNYPEGEADHPVIFVSWHQAMAYAQWVGKRLPTEAEWEKAARAGLEKQLFPWGNSSPDGTQCNFADKNTNFRWSDIDVDDGYRLAAPIGSYPPNAYGLYDMAGNVSEWCLDAYHYKIDDGSKRINPIGGPDNKTYVVENYLEIETERPMRGGAWNADAQFLQVTARSNYPPANTDSDLGFRCVKDVTSLV